MLSLKILYIAHLTVKELEGSLCRR